MRELENRQYSQAQQRGENPAHQRLRKERFQAEEVAEPDRDQQSGVNHQPHHRRQVLSRIQVAQAGFFGQL
jgi:hypothetical protein